MTKKIEWNIWMSYIIFPSKVILIFIDFSMNTVQIICLRKSLRLRKNTTQNLVFSFFFLLGRPQYINLATASLSVFAKQNCYAYQRKRKISYSFCWRWWKFSSYYFRILLIDGVRDMDSICHVFDFCRPLTTSCWELPRRDWFGTWIGDTVSNRTHWPITHHMLDFDGDSFRRKWICRWSPYDGCRRICHKRCKCWLKLSDLY